MVLRKMEDPLQVRLLKIYQIDLDDDWGIPARLGKSPPSQSRGLTGFFQALFGQRVNWSRFFWHSFGTWKNTRSVRAASGTNSRAPPDLQWPRVKICKAVIRINMDE